MRVCHLQIYVLMLNVSSDPLITAGLTVLVVIIIFVSQREFILIKIVKRKLTSFIIAKVYAKITITSRIAMVAIICSSAENLPRTEIIN